MPQQKAYLVVHKLALFNDEWFNDYTLEVGVANPAALFATQAEAQTYVQTRTRELMRGKSFSDLELDQPEELALQHALKQPGTFDPALNKTLQSFLNDRNKALPGTLTDEQLDAILTVSHLKLFHILEAEIDDFNRTLAQSTLALTPERPFIGMEFWYDENHEEEPDYKPGEVIEETDDPAAERLNRVTALFGRKYATGIMI